MNGRRGVVVHPGFVESVEPSPPRARSTSADVGDAEKGPDAV
jgi:hypothetical protein